MIKYKLTNRAVEDLEQIWNYTYETWSESQADKYYQMIVDSFTEISKNLDIGKRYSEVDKRLLGFKVGRHIIFYMIEESSLRVMRILHERMDLKSKFQNQ